MRACCKVIGRSEPGHWLSCSAEGQRQIKEVKTMTKHAFARGLGAALFGGFFLFGFGSSLRAEELRVGFLAPTTGIFAQVGKDMVDGFQMYLDEVKNDFAGAQVKFIVEDEQGK